MFVQTEKRPDLPSPLQMWCSPSLRREQFGAADAKILGIRILVWEDRTSPSCLTALVR